MTNLPTDLFGTNRPLDQRAFNRTHHARRARLMVAVAVLSAFGLVAVATALLAYLT